MSNKVKEKKIDERNAMPTTMVVTIISLLVIVFTVGAFILKQWYLLLSQEQFALFLL